ncbi:MAG: DUF5666 domain-containing protein [Candidatus Omnitrophota bacterium]
MKKSKMTISVLIAAAFLVLLGWTILSADKVAAGMVKSVGVNQLVIIHEPEEGTSHQEMTFVVNEDTDLREMDAFSDLAEGDRIEVKYKEKDTEHVATSITKITVDRAYEQRASLSI